jgi:hypothetical protein
MTMKTIEDSQANCCDREEINGHQLSDMIPKKRHPGLCGLPVLRNQSRNRPFGNLESKLQQFSMDARRSPDGIGATIVRINLRISELSCGHPGLLGWDNLHQYRLRCHSITVSG